MDGVVLAMTIQYHLQVRYLNKYFEFNFNITHICTWVLLLKKYLFKKIINLFHCLPWTILFYTDHTISLTIQYHKSLSAMFWTSWIFVTFLWSDYIIKISILISQEYMLALFSQKYMCCEFFDPPNHPIWSSFVRVDFIQWNGITIRFGKWRHFSQWGLGHSVIPFA